VGAHPPAAQLCASLQIARDHGIAPERAPKGGGGGGGSSRGKAAPPAPLSRDEAWAKAQLRTAAMGLPHRLLNGVTVSSFGTVTLDPGYVSATTLAPPGFTSHWTDANGVGFTSTIIPAGNGPYYSVRAGRAPAGAGTSASDPEAQVGVEVGSGPTPDEAWRLAAERQGEVMEIVLMRGHNQARGGADEEGDSEELDAGDELLAQAAPLAGQWGLERFGLADIGVLQALEGLPGVEGSVYQFVEQRGGWDEESRALVREAARLGKVAAVRTATGGGRRREGSAPRSDRRPRTQAERDAVTVRKLMDGMLRQLETGEARHSAAEHRARLKQEKDMQRAMEKEQRRLAKERCERCAGGKFPSRARLPPCTSASRTAFSPLPFRCPPAQGARDCSAAP
jgi:hypothetical protein